MLMKDVQINFQISTKRLKKEVPRRIDVKKKSHTTLFPKKFIPLSLENLKFLIGCCAWRVTKIYSHYTFEQNAFKKDFVLNNKKERQNAKSDIERDFFKLMNYANFGVDFRNNANNSTFKLISEKINEISYLKKYCNLFDNRISGFV